MLCAVRSHAALTDKFGILQQFTQYNGLIAVSVNVGVRIKYNGELTRKPACAENENRCRAGSEREGSEQRFPLCAKTKPTAVGAEKQQCAVAEKQEAQISKAWDL